MPCPVTIHGERVLDNSLAWHTVIMGTGVTPALVHNFSYGHGCLLVRIVTLIVLVFFLVISPATVARYALFPSVWSNVLRHPAQSLFVGAVPISFATLINIALDMNQDTGFGRLGLLYFLWVCWWIDVTASVLSIVQTQTFSGMTAVWLLPVVTLVVASSTGGLISVALRPESSTLSLITTGTSVTMLVIGLSLALMMITIYLGRLIIYGPPDTNLIPSAFVVLGPLGQGGYSLLANGADLAALSPLYVSDELPTAGQLLYSFCFCGSFILWSMGICWISSALLSILSVSKKSGIPSFGLAYWGLIFPNGVYALLSVKLGNVLDSGFFRVFGSLWSCAVFLLWIAILIRTVSAIIDRSIFHAPCLAASPTSPTIVDLEGDSSGLVSSQASSHIPLDSGFKI